MMLLMPMLLALFIASLMLLFKFAMESLFFTVGVPLCLLTAAVMVAIDAWQSRRRAPPSKR